MGVVDRLWHGHLVSLFSCPTQIGFLLEPRRKRKVQAKLTGHKPVSSPPPSSAKSSSCAPCAISIRAGSPYRRLYGCMSFRAFHFPPFHISSHVSRESTTDIDPSTIENDIGIICACLPALAPLRSTRLFSKIIPSSVQYLLQKSGYSSHRSTSSSSSTFSSGAHHHHHPQKEFKGSSAAQAKKMGYQRSDESMSGVELAQGKGVKGYGMGMGNEKALPPIRSTTDVEVIYSKPKHIPREASNMV